MSKGEIQVSKQPQMRPLSSSNPCLNILDDSGWLNSGMPLKQKPSPLSVHTFLLNIVEGRNDAHSPQGNGCLFVDNSNNSLQINSNLPLLFKDSDTIHWGQPNDAGLISQLMEFRNRFAHLKPPSRSSMSDTTMSINSSSTFQDYGRTLVH